MRRLPVGGGVKKLSLTASVASTFVIPEAVLRWSPGGLDLMAAQLERLVAVDGQENLSIGVVVRGREPVLPLHGGVGPHLLANGP